MSDLRNLCRCGHTRSSHGEGSCRTCSCASWFPAYPVYDGALPAFVEPLRDYRNGLTLVVCHHAVEHRVDGADLALDGEQVRCSFCWGDLASTDGYRRPVKRLVFAPRELVLL